MKKENWELGIAGVEMCWWLVVHQREHYRATCGEGLNSIDLGILDQLSRGPSAADCDDWCSAAIADDVDACSKSDAAEAAAALWRDM